MKRVIGAMGALALLAVCSAPVQASAEALGNIDKGRVIFLEGKGDASACAGCHGADGLGNDDMGTPRLAYQVDTYILKQLTDFATDKRFDNVAFAMNDIAKALSPEDRKDVAAYVNSLKTPFLGSDLDVLRENGADVGEVYLGQVIAEVGLPDHGVPACQSCHDFHGRSAGRMYPAIGGQRYTYLKHELEAFRLGETTASSEDQNARDNDYNAQMRAVAAKMTDEDIANVAAFLTGAKPITPGNPRAPVRQ